MNQQQLLSQMSYHLAEAFRLIAGLRPNVYITGHNAAGQPVIAVGFRGDHLVELMRIEAFLAEKGEVIMHRSRFHGGWTSLVYHLKSR